MTNRLVLRSRRAVWVRLGEIGVGKRLELSVNLLAYGGEVLDVELLGLVLGLIGDGLALSRRR